MTFTATVDAQHPDQAHTTMHVSFRLERPAGDVDIRVRTIVTLSSMTIDVDVTLAGFNMLRQSWTKDWGAT
jgi:hypothetical protein